ncbi:hypothetical protein ACVWWQ_001459 [Rhodanobacter sp. TND4EL1]
MRTIRLVGVLALLCLAGAAVSGTTEAPKERLVKSIELQAFFHTAHPWQARIYEPAGQSAEFGHRPMRACFVKQQGAVGTHAECMALFSDAALPDGTVLPLQNFDSADLEVLPSPDGGPGRPSLVVRASFSGGGPGRLNGLFVWTDTSRDHQGQFTQTFKSVVSQAGEQKFVRKGPLAGAFVEFEQVYEGDEANMESPVRYQMAIYEPAPLGYVKVLSVLSEKRYPSNHTRDGLPNAIATLTPAMSRVLKAVYPQGVSALQQ